MQSRVKSPNAEEKDFVEYNSKNEDAYFEQLLKMVQSFPSTCLSPFQAVMFVMLSKSTSVNLAR